MRRLAILLVLLVCMTGTASASMAAEQAASYGADRLYDSLPDGMDVEPDEDVDWNGSLKKLLLSALEGSTATVRGMLRTLLEVLLIAVFCQMMADNGQGRSARMALFLGTAALVGSSVSQVQGAIGLGLSAVDSMQTFSDALMPVMASAAAGAGAGSSASGLYAVTVFFSNLLMRFCSRLLRPMLYGALALAVTDTVLQSQRMKQLRELLCWLLRTGMKAVLYLFTGFLSVTGVLAGSADAAALKAAKITVSGMVPVVGGIISDAAETVLASAGVLKNGIGTVGILAVVAIFLLPYLKIGISYLGFRVASGLCALLESRLTGTLEAISQSMGLVLAMVGTCTLMNLLACFSFMRAVGI